MLNLNGRHYLIIGGGGVLGQAIIAALIEAGCRITFTWANDKKRAMLLALKYNAEPEELNLAKDYQLKYYFENLEYRFDGIVIAAGINKPGALADTDDFDIYRVIDTNLTGVVKAVKYGLPAIKDNGSMVIIGSSSAITGGPTSVHYAASKAGLEGLVRGAARWGAERGIRCNLIHPGYVASPLAANKAATGMISRVLLKRQAEAEEIAGSVLFLLSSLSAYITGQVINVDGGILPGGAF